MDAETLTAWALVVTAVGSVVTAVLAHLARKDIEVVRQDVNSGHKLENEKKAEQSVLLQEKAVVVAQLEAGAVATDKALQVKEVSDEKLSSVVSKNIELEKQLAQKQGE